jgi:hypothetical protein
MFQIFSAIDTELNPIELIWAQVKGFVAKNNTTFRLKDAKELTYAAFGKITKDVWTKAEEHVVKIEKFYFFVYYFLVSVAENGMLCCVR